MKKAPLYNRSICIATAMFILLLTLSLTACGGGGGGGGGSSSSNPSAPDVVSGVAATGAPIVGQVSLKDSVGNNVDRGPVPTNADGSFSFDVTGLTPPFFLFAEETGDCEETDTCKEFYSVTLGAGTSNINTLTNLAVWAATGGTDPADVYENSDEYVDEIIAGLDDAIDDIIIFLKAVLDHYEAEGIDAFSGPYEADGSGIDGVVHNLDINIKVDSGKVSIELNGTPLRSDLDDLDTIEPITANEVEEALNPPPSSSVQGIGQTCPFPASLNLNVPAAGGGTLLYDFQDTFFQSTSINAPVISEGTATITGSGSLNGEAGHIFKAIVIDGSPDKMSMEIDGIPYPLGGSSLPLPLIGGAGLTIAGGSVSGIGQTCPFPATLALDVALSSLETSTVTYDFQDAFFQSTSINTPVVISGGTATIRGSGSLNGEAGHIFKAIVIDGSPDKMSMEIDGIPYPLGGSSLPLPLTGGAGYTIEE
ncbi:MAG: hypothetical protein C4560_11815 [Nitrospiraceae bacterium]|nr:MAG: hypothetical protein C4560_11815 [Nitrospiraceae bacterium]